MVSQHLWHHVQRLAQVARNVWALTSRPNLHCSLGIKSPLKALKKPWESRNNDYDSGKTMNLGLDIYLYVIICIYYVLLHYE